MPKAFEECVRRGGRVRTINPKPGKYMHICFLNGKSYAGEVKQAESKTANAIKEHKNG